MLTANMAWLFLFIIGWAVVLLVVPWSRMAGLLLPGFLGGAVLGLIINLIAVPVLGLWRFQATPISLLGIPVFLMLAYMAETVLFLHYWDYLPGGSTEKGLYLITFGLLDIGAAYFSLLMGYVVFSSWTLLYALITSFVTHTLALLLYSAPGLHEVRD